MLPQELHMTGDTPSQLRCAGLSWAQPLAIPIAPLPLRQGQVWARRDLLTGTYLIYEITGFHSDIVLSVLHWEVTQVHPTTKIPTKVLLQLGTSAMRGAASLQSLTVTEMFPDPPTVEYLLVTLSTEKFSGGNNTATCKALRVRIPLVSTTTLATETFPWFRDVTSPITTTAFSEPHNLVLELFKGQTSRSLTSVLMKSEDTEFATIQHALVIQHQTSNYLSETNAQTFSLFAAASQSRRPRQTYMTSSATAHKLHRKAKSKPIAHHLAPILCPQVAARMFPIALPSAPQADAYELLTRNPFITPSLEGAHQDSAYWSRSFLLRAKSFTPQQLQSFYPSSTITHMSDVDFLRPLLVSPFGALCIGDDRIPTLAIYKTLHQQRITKEYYAARDEYHQTACDKLHQYTCPSYWSHGYYALAADILKHVARGASLAFVSRIVLDKHLTGRNKLKQELLPDDHEEVGRCQLCDAQLEDQRHILCHCQHPPDCGHSKR